MYARWVCSTYIQHEDEIRPNSAYSVSPCLHVQSLTFSLSCHCAICFTFYHIFLFYFFALRAITTSVGKLLLWRLILISLTNCCPVFGPSFVFIIQSERGKH